MRMYVVQTADNGDLGAPRDVLHGRAAAMARRRALAAGGSAPASTHERVHTGLREAPAAPTRRGRALSMQRRRQLAQGKQAPDGAGAPPFVVLRGGGR